MVLVGLGWGVTLLCSDVVTLVVMRTIDSSPSSDAGETLVVTLMVVESCGTVGEMLVVTLMVDSSDSDDVDDVFEVVTLMVDSSVVVRWKKR